MNLGKIYKRIVENKSNGGLVAKVMAHYFSYYLHFCCMLKII